MWYLHSKFMFTVPGHELPRPVDSQLVGFGRSEQCTTFGCILMPDNCRSNGFRKTNQAGTRYLKGQLRLRGPVVPGNTLAGFATLLAGLARWSTAQLPRTDLDSERASTAALLVFPSLLYSNLYRLSTTKIALCFIQESAITSGWARKVFDNSQQQSDNPGPGGRG